MNTHYFYETLKAVLEIDSPSGMTEAMMSFIEQKIAEMGYSVQHTNKGSIYAEITGNTDKNKLLIVSHCDTIGAIVSQILDDGRLKIVKVGGLNCGGFEGNDAHVYTRNHGKLTGTFMPIKDSAHVDSSNCYQLDRIDENMVVRLDLPVYNKQQAIDAGVNVGDMIAFPANLRILDNGIIKSHYIDDKACVAVQLALMKAYSEQSELPKRSVCFYFSDNEEVGHGLYAYPDDVNEVIALDIGPMGTEQNNDEELLTIIAKDAKVVYDYHFRRKLEHLAEENGIAFCNAVYNRYGSDASAALIAGADFKCVCLGPSTYATHHYERTHYNSLKAMYDLLKAYID